MKRHALAVPLAVAFVASLVIPALAEAEPEVPELALTRWKGPPPRVHVMMGRGASARQVRACERAVMSYPVLFDPAAPIRAIIENSNGNRLHLLSQERGVLRSEYLPGWDVPTLCRYSLAQVLKEIAPGQEGGGPAAPQAPAILGPVAPPLDPAPGSAPRSGLGPLIAGSILFPLGVLNLISSAACTTLSSSAEGACIGAAAGVGGGMLLVGLPTFIIGLVQNSQYQRWKRMHPTGSALLGGLGIQAGPQGAAASLGMSF